MRRGLLSVCAVLLMLIMAGCGSLKYNIAGSVTESGGQGISGVTLTLSGSKFNGTATTSANGSWSATVAGTVTVSPQKENWSFSPVSVNVSKAAQNVNFVGQKTTALLTHAGFNFSTGEFYVFPDDTVPDTFVPDGDIINWRPFPSSPYVTGNIWLRSARNDSDNFVADLGAVSFSSVGNVASTEFPVETPALAVNHVYVIRCTNGGWAKILVLSIDSDAWQAQVQWRYSATGQF